MPRMACGSLAVRPGCTSGRPAPNPSCASSPSRPTRRVRAHWWIKRAGRSTRPAGGSAMCGIVGYVGHRECLPILIEGIKRLEYRGYDSAGVALHGQDRLQVVKAAGKIRQLEARLLEHPVK